MFKCRINRFDTHLNAVVQYNCGQVRILSKKWIEESAKECRAEELEKIGRKNTAHDTLVKEVNDFLSSCKCLEELKCTKCSKEDHEGYFCRCESRNIEIAHKLRNVDLKPMCRDGINSPFSPILKRE